MPKNFPKLQRRNNHVWQEVCSLHLKYFQNICHWIYYDFISFKIDCVAILAKVIIFSKVFTQFPFDIVVVPAQFELFWPSKFGPKKLNSKSLIISHLSTSRPLKKL